MATFNKDFLVKNGLDVGDDIKINGTTVIDTSGEVVTSQLKDSGVTAATYGSSSNIPQITVDAKGRITSASNVAVTIANDYVDSASFNTADGTLTLGRTGSLSDITVDLDGRYQIAGTYDNYVSWGASDGTNSAAITSGETVTIVGSGATTVTFDGITQTYTITSTDTDTNTDTNDYVDSASFNVLDGVLTLGRTGTLPDLTVDLDGRYLTSYTDTNDYVDSVSFNTADGVLTLGRTGALADLTVDLDGRYLTTYTDTDTTYSIALSDGAVGEVDIDLTAGGSGTGTDTVTLKQGNGISLSRVGDVVTIGFTGSATDTNDYVDSVSFNQLDGVLTLGRTGALADLTVDLDGRYLTSYTETVTSLTPDSINQKLVYVDENGTSNDVDLSWAIDDTNLARIISGSIDAAGTATFTRDDATSFTIDMSSFLDDTNNYVNGASFNTADGILTLTRSGLTDVTVDLDGRYLTSFTESDTLQTVTTRGNSTTNNIVVDNDDGIKVTYSTDDNLWLKGYGLEFGRTTSYIRPTTNLGKNLYVGATTLQWSEIEFNTPLITHRGSVQRTYGGNTVETQLRVGADGAWSSIGNFSAHPVHIRTGNTDRVVVEADGDVHIAGSGSTIAATNLGAGTLKLGGTAAAPGLALDNNEIVFASDAYIGTAAAQALNLRTNGANTRVSILSGGQTVFGDSVTNGTAMTTGGTARISIYESSVALSFGSSNTDLSYIRRQSAGNYAWQTYNAANTGSIQLQPYGGNVGIGTASPAYKFHLDGNPGASTLLSRFYNTSINGQGLLIRAGETGSADRVLQLASRLDTKIMTVNSDGNVGIGTDTPSSVLHVNGGTGKWGIFERNGKQLYINANWSANNAYAQVAPRGTDGMGLSLSSKDSNPEYLMITNAGNVGIGTIDPNSKLHVSGTGNQNIRITSTDSGSPYYGLYQGATEVAYYQYTNGVGATLQSDLKLTLRVDSSNVAVFDTTFSEIAGSTWDNTAGSGLRVTNSSTVGAGISLKPTASTSYSAGWALYAGAASAGIGDGSIGFWNHTASDWKFKIDQAGNVTIPDGNVTLAYTGTNPAIDVTGHAGAASYNYVLRGWNDTGSKAIHFINGSTRTTDGGANTYTIRNDGGTLRLGHDSHKTLIEGTQLEVSVGSGGIYMNRDGIAGDAITLDHVENSDWAFLFKSSSVGNDNHSGFWVNADGTPDMRLRSVDGTVRSIIHSNGLSYINGGNLSIGTTLNESKLHIYQNAAAPVLLTLHNYQSDILGTGNSQGNFIDFKMTDDNATFTPQVRIGMLVNDYSGDAGIDSEGTGNFVVYTSQGTGGAGAGSLTERFRVGEDGRIVATNFQAYPEGTIGTKLQGISSISFNDTSSNWTDPQYHGIRSTDPSGNWGDDISINSYQNITLRVDSNNNNTDAFVRFMNNTTTSNEYFYAGMNSSSQYIAYIAGNLGVNTTPRTDGYKLSMGGSVHMNNNPIHYASEVHFNDGVRFYDDGNNSNLNFKWDNAGGGGIKFVDGDGSLQGQVYGNGAQEFGLLDRDGQWAVRIVPDSYVELRDNNEATFRAGQGGVTGDYGSVQTVDAGKGGWAGYSIGGRVVFMHDVDTSNWGIYNDVNNEWMIYGGLNGNVELRFDNTWRGRTTSTGFEVNGLLTATQKSFTINHPTKEGYKLRYGSLEGPENGIYVRGKLKGENVIELPEYWTKLVDPDSITVTLTAIGGKQDLWVEDIVDNTVIVGGEGEINCFYMVFAERIDVDKLEVEFPA